MSAPLVGYVVHQRDSDAPLPVGQLYDYVFAGNGVFLRGRRAGVDVLVPVARAEVRGLAPVEPYCHFLLPRVPAVALGLMLRAARDACAQEPNEALFHLTYIEARGEWRLDLPEQEATATSVRPLHAGPGSSYATSVIEVHSHHGMSAFFSRTDDRDEQGFKLYGVLGTIFDRPVLKLRVGVYGHFLSIDASVAFELPESVADGQRGSRSAPVEIEEIEELGIGDDHAND